MAKSILLRTPYKELGHRLCQIAPDYEVIVLGSSLPGPQGSMEFRPEDVLVVLGVTSEDRLDLFPHLQWVHSNAAGVDDLFNTGVIPPDVTFTSAVGNGAIPLAEHALMLMLMLNRDAPRWLRAQQEQRWDRFVHGELAGATLGIIGYGNVGQDLARKAEACHMNVQAIRRHQSDNSSSRIKMHHGSTGLSELLRSSDYVVVTSPLTPDTENLLDRDQIMEMKPGAALIVVSRGGIVNELAMIEALESGHLSGAGIDAHAEEPLGQESPLWNMPNVIVTPHNGATTSQTELRREDILIDNASRWMKGLPLRNVVNPVQGY